MPKFAYIAVDSAGKESRGTIEAPNQAQAVAKVRGMGLFPTAIGAAGGSEGGGAAKPAPAPAAKKAGKKSMGQTKIEIKLPKFLRPKVKQKDLMTLTRQLATLVDAGLPLLRGLHVLQRQTPHVTLKEALAGMCESVESGSTFSESLLNYPKIFDNLYVNMVRAGEAGGVLEVVLNRLAEFAEKGEKIKNKVKGAMVYPIVVLVAAVGITGFLLVAVIPKFKDIFNDCSKASPAGDHAVVMDAGNMVMNNGLMVVAAIAVIVVLFKLFAKTEVRALHGRHGQDQRADVRFVGAQDRCGTHGLVRLARCSPRACRCLGDQHRARHHWQQGPRARHAERAPDAVKEGEHDRAAGGFQVFPMVVSMVEVGEETGALPDMLMRRNTYDDEVDNAVAGLTSVIEPLMIIILAVVVGTIVIAMFMPMVRSTTTLGSQA